MGNLYSNIGKKIKFLAVAMCIAEALAAVIYGFTFFSRESTVGIGLLLIFIGPVVAWVTSWILYGFGELIDTASDVNQSIYSINATMESERKQKSTETADKSSEYEEPYNFMSSSKDESADSDNDKGSNQEQIEICKKNIKHLESLIEYNKKLRMDTAKLSFYKNFGIFTMVAGIALTIAGSALGTIIIAIIGILCAAGGVCLFYTWKTQKMKDDATADLIFNDELKLRKYRVRLERLQAENNKQ